MKQTKPKPKKNLFLNILLVICVMGVLISAYMIFLQIQEAGQGNAVYDEVRELAPASDAAPQESLKPEGIESQGYVFPDFEALLARNSDTVGWINIPNTVISYPVMQAADNDFYLYKDFNKDYLKQGSVFASYQNRTDPLDQNMVLYGHNMGYGRSEMFSTLVEYKTQAYFRQHPVIQFDTPAGSGLWEIAAVYQYDVRELEQYNFAQSQFVSEQEFLSFAQQAQSRSLYQTGVEIREGDRLLTLSTCDRTYGGENGRLIVVAVLRDGTLAGRE
ncbi:MAG: class B sortase [Christensenellales bacterium]|jgi:sortase B